MKIHGLQKMTLLDFPGHVACTVFLGGCDFRCPFCHNFELVDGTMQPVMDEEELLAFLEKRTGLLDGVAFTGGEPCLHAELPALLAKIRAMGFATKLDTNGNHPALLKEILDAGLVDYVAMDIKNSPEKYMQTIGLADAKAGSGPDQGDAAQVILSNIRESIALLMGSGVDYEFRTTTIDQLHGAEDFEAIGELIAGAKRYFIQAFTDRDAVPFGGLSAPPVEALQTYADIVRKHVGTVRIRGVDDADT